MNTTDAAEIKNELQWLKQSFASTGEPVDEIRELITGNGRLGIAQKVTIMWRIHAVVAGICGAPAGSVATYLVMRII